MGIEAGGGKDYTYANMRQKRELDNALNVTIGEAVDVAERLDSLSGSLKRRVINFWDIQRSKKELETIAQEASRIARDKELLEDIKDVSYFKGIMHYDSEEKTHIKGELNGQYVNIQRHISCNGRYTSIYGYVDKKDISPDIANEIFARYERILDAREKKHNLLFNPR
ncbi:MAG: hypothetical protein KBC00_01985 [Candidatus Levybacteria bacterium]|nr:hypothetical protein [Candidatus Levybacteria bacterium]MBP9815374.1 hypothetical protein [Candidatus Levybacteria bacterium]